MKMILEVLCLIGCGANIYLGLLLFIMIILALCSWIKDKVKKIKEKRIEKAEKRQHLIKLLEDLRKDLVEYNELRKELLEKNNKLKREAEMIQNAVKAAIIKLIEEAEDGKGSYEDEE